jgi:hypothetical protein
MEKNKKMGMSKKKKVGMFASGGKGIAGATGRSRLQDRGDREMLCQDR